MPTITCLTCGEQREVGKGGERARYCLKHKKEYDRNLARVRKRRWRERNPAIDAAYRQKYTVIRESWSKITSGKVKNRRPIEDGTLYVEETRSEQNERDLVRRQFLRPDEGAMGASQGK